MNCKKIFSLLVVVVMIVSFTIISSACKAEEKDGTEPADATAAVKETNSTESSEEPEIEMVGNMYIAGYPIVKDKASFSIASLKDADHGPYSEMSIVTKAEEMTNVHIEWIEVPVANSTETKNLMFAGGDLPDAFFSGMLNDNDHMMYGTQGLIIPLETLIDEYGVNLMNNVFNQRPDVFKLCTAPDGHIYSLPTVHEELFLNVADNLFINTIWLESLGLNIPETTEEFYETLKAFKDADLNNNGENDEIPFSFIFDNAAAGIFSMFGAFGYPDNAKHMVIDDGKVVHTASQEGYLEAVKYLNMLYSEGLIDEESFTHDMGQYVAKGNNTDTLYGAFLGWHKAMYVGNDKNDEFTAVLPLKGPEGIRYWNRNDAQYSRSAFSITSAAENPEIVMRWVDTIYDVDNSLEWCFGTFGICTQLNDDGSFEWLPSPEGIGLEELRHQNTPGRRSPNAYLAEVSAKFKRSWEVVEKGEYTEAYLPYLYEGVYPKVYLTAAQSEELSALSTDLNNYINKTQAEWIVNGNAENEWEDYLTQLNNMGLARYIEIYQEAYDVFMGK